MTENKAFVCFLVDGPTDIDALQDPLAELFDRIGGDNISVDFRYARFQRENHGDITSLRGVTPDNVEKMIYKYYFKQQDQESDVGWDDLTSIIHIIDLDGAFIKNDRILEYTAEEEKLAKSLITNKQPKSTLYFDDHIAVGLTKKPSLLAVSDIEDRNKQKRQIIEHLWPLETITVKKKTVNYRLFYFSSNLDHFLYGEANLTGPEKLKYASAFGRKINDSEALIKFFEESPYCKAEDYSTSWKKLRKGNASLLRGSNVNVLLEAIINSSIEDWL